LRSKYVGVKFPLESNLFGGQQFGGQKLYKFVMFSGIISAEKGEIKYIYIINEPKRIEI
jgi:hypothetical protein